MPSDAVTSCFPPKCLSPGRGEQPAHEHDQSVPCGDPTDDAQNHDERMSLRELFVVDV
jgi:hypothetical protein